MRYGHLLQHMVNTPLALHPRKAEVILAALGDRLGLNLSALAPDDDDDFDFRAPGETGRGSDPGYDLVGPVAIIPVTGTLVQKTGTLRPWSGLTGYDGLRQAFCTAIDDPEVKAIQFHVDSPGGEVAGCFDLVDLIHSARGSKPIWAVADENAFSAAYAIASAADRVLVPRTGGVGSVGVICAHVDFSQAIDKAGLKVTIIKRGAKKADGRPEIPLSDSAEADMQAEIDAIGELFEATVARNRDLTPKAVRDLQAATFLGANGVRVGLADAVMAPDAAYRALLAELG